MKTVNIQNAIQDLLKYCSTHDWSGYDPYDGLNSRLFQATPFRHSRFARLILIQTLKRSPFNFRPLLGVPQLENPKGLALFASAAVRLQRLGLAGKGLDDSLLERLLRLRSPGFEALCWGYPFDWQNRHFMLPRYHPNIICSSFGGHALLDGYEQGGSPSYRECAVSVANFICTGLNRTPDGGSFCFSYTPLDHGGVHNANLLGAAFLARVWGHTGDELLQQDALHAARYSVDRQRRDGSWVYGESTKQQWVDGFHTGYNLLALRRLHQAFDLPWLKDAMDKGYAYYRAHFIRKDGVAPYYQDKIYPLDIHSTAQAIITLTEFSDYDSEAIGLAECLLDWACRNMRHREGFYYYQKHRHWINRTPYMRWSQAWMLLAMACLAEALGRPAHSRNSGLKNQS